MKTLLIREATMQDCESIQSVHAGTPGPWANIDECIPWIKKRLERGYYVQIAEYNSQVAGHAEWVETRDPSGKFFYLCVMQIKAEYQGQGIGRAMVDDGIRVAKELGAAKVVTIPDEETGSEKFYAKCDFADGRQIKSVSIPTKDYGYSQGYREVGGAPFEVIKECKFIIGLSQASARHMWEVNNEKPEGDDRVTSTLMSDNGDCIQICSLYSNPSSAWALYWGNIPKPVVVRDILTFGKAKGFEEISFDFFAGDESLFCEFDVEIEPYCVEMYKLL